MNWDSKLYDDKHGFVAEYGKGLLEYMPDTGVSDILDLGCGTGALTCLLSGYGRRIAGVDSSPEMIAQAKENYPDIDFRVHDALDLPFVSEFDVVFSNAVFHWISDHDKLLKNISSALRTGGVLLCEFGGEGNIAAIDNAFSVACKNNGISYRSKFNFPSGSAFSSCLENNGFRVDKAYIFQRPTPLKDGENGLRHWLKQFYAAELAVLPDGMQCKVLAEAETLCRSKLWNGSEWIADYCRLRVIARKL